MRLFAEESEAFSPIAIPLPFQVAARWGGESEHSAARTRISLARNLGKHQDSVS
jgi:hypothetical protein